MKVVSKNVKFWSQNSRGNAAKSLKLVRIFLKRLYLLISRVLMNLEIKLAIRHVYFQRLFGPF